VYEGSDHRLKQYIKEMLLLIKIDLKRKCSLSKIHSPIVTDLNGFQL